MNPLILIYLFTSIAVAVSAGSNAGWAAGLSALGTGWLCLLAGGGCKASLYGDKAQKIGGPVIAAIIMFLTLHFLASEFSVHLFGVAFTGQEWGWLGAITCFLFTDRKLAGVTPRGVDAWFLSLPLAQDVSIPIADYSDALKNYQGTAQHLVGWRHGPGKPDQEQPETVDLRPLLATLTNVQFLFNRPLIAKYDGEQAYQFPDPLESIRAHQTVDGVVSVLFLAGELPTMSAWDHGLYDRDYELITTDVELSNALEDFDPDEGQAITIPAGVRVRREGNTLFGKCLMYSFTEGFAELTIQIGPDGIAAKRGLESILKPEGTRFY